MCHRTTSPSLLYSARNNLSVFIHMQGIQLNISVIRHQNTRPSVLTRSVSILVTDERNSSISA